MQTRLNRSNAAQTCVVQRLPVLWGLQSRQTVINNKNNNRKMLNLRGGGNREDKGIVWHYLIPSPPTFASQLALIFACHCRKLTVLSQTPVLNLIGKEKTRREYGHYMSPIISLE